MVVEKAEEWGREAFKEARRAVWRAWAVGEVSRAAMEESESESEFDGEAAERRS